MTDPVFRFFECKQTEHAAHNHEAAETEEKQIVADHTGLRQRADADHHACCNERERGKHGFHLRAVFRRGHVGDPSVKHGVVACGTHKRHQAVHQDDRPDRRRQNLYFVRQMQQRRNTVARDQTEQRRDNAPQDVADRNEQLAPVEPVAECAHKKGRNHRRCRRQSDHQADRAHHGDRAVNCSLGYAGIDFVVQEGVEIHVFNIPCELTDQTEQYHIEPQPAGDPAVVHTRFPPKNIVKFIITDFFEKFNCYLAIIAKTCRKMDPHLQQVVVYLKYI